MINTNKFSFLIANLSIDIESPIPLTDLGIVERYSSFFHLRDDGLEKISLKWQDYDRNFEIKGKPVFDPGLVWEMYKTETDYLANLNYHDENFKPQMKCVLKINFDYDHFLLMEDRNHHNWSSMLNAGAGELILRTAIINNHGLVFHASGFDDNGYGILFVGHAGAGKSTQLNIWMEETKAIPMNDDRIAVSIRQKDVMCHGTPWGGSSNIAFNHSAPLKAIVVLNKAMNSTIHRISTEDASSLLVARSFLPYWDEKLMVKAMATLDEIINLVPVYSLCCRPNKETIDLVRSVL